MTLPGRPAATRRRATRCVHSSTWRRLLLYSASQPFSVVSSSGDLNTPPALLTRIDTSPSSSTVRCSAASTCSLSRTSTTMPSAPNAFRGRRAGVGIAFPDGHRGTERRHSRGDAPADTRSPAGHHRDAAGEQDVGRIDGHRSRLARLGLARSHRRGISDHALGLQLRDLLAGQSEFGQQFVVVLVRAAARAARGRARDRGRT